MEACCKLSQALVSPLASLLIDALASPSIGPLASLLAAGLGLSVCSRGSSDMIGGSEGRLGIWVVVLVGRYASRLRYLDMMEGDRLLCVWMVVDGE